MKRFIGGIDMSEAIRQAVTPTRPVLRYHGGKWRLGQWIVSNLPPHRIYVEPYSGAASILLQKPRCNGEMINDLDGEIVNVLRVLRNPAQARELERLLRLTPYSRSEYESSYLSDGDPIEQARRTIIKSFMGFGSDGITATWTTGFRDNLTRDNGTPARDWSGYPDAIKSITDRLSAVVIENRPAIRLIKKHDTAETLFYVDPPYPHSTRPGIVKRKHSYRFEMSDDDHRELARVLREIKGMAVISGYRCDLYDQELYSDWFSIERKTFADAAQKRVEVLWLNDAAMKARKQQSLF